MHACGHDGHMSALLAAGKILFQSKNTLKGTVKLIFQPAEEGYGGAKLMIEEGVLLEVRPIKGLLSLYNILIYILYIFII